MTTRARPLPARPPVRQAGPHFKPGMPAPHVPVPPLPKPGPGFGMPGPAHPMAGVVDESPPGYSIEKKLGEGGFGCVFRALHLRTNTICALKSVDIGSLSQKYRKLAIQQWLVEIEALVKVTAHPNVVGYHKAFDTGWKLWVEMEFCAGGDLTHYLSGWKTRISRSVKLKITRDISAAIKYLHDQGIVHRDIKAQNVLVAYKKANDPLDITAKLADFGLAKVIATCNFDGSLETYYMDATCGTKYYLAPEVLQGKYTLMADIFSMAVLFTAIVTESKIPAGHPGHGFMTSYIKDSSGKIWAFGDYMIMTKTDVALKSSFNAGENLRNLINSMLKYDYHKRPSAKEVNSRMSTEISVGDFPKEPKTSRRTSGDRPVPPPPQ